MAVIEVDPLSNPGFRKRYWCFISRKSRDLAFYKQPLYGVIPRNLAVREAERDYFNTDFISRLFKTNRNKKCQQDE